MLLSIGPITFDFSIIDWKVILGFVAVLVTVFGLLYFQWWRNRKRLSYEVLSDVLLISAEKELQDKVEIRYEDQSVKNVRLLVVKLINDGYQPIKKDDFEKEVTFRFPGANILTAEQIKLYPENLGTKLSYRDNWVAISPALLNRKDYLQFKVLLSGYETLEIDARIVGVSGIGKTRRLRPDLHLVSLVIICGLISFLGGVVTSVTAAHNVLVFSVVGLVAAIAIANIVLRKNDK